MAYNYPLLNYQNPYQMQQSIPQPQQNNSAGIIWVQGEAGAKAYPVAPGNSVLLMDSESECFYIKSTDASGIPMPLRTFSYTELKENVSHETNSIDTSQFITRQEFDELKETIKSMQEIKEEVSKPSKRRALIDE